MNDKTITLILGLAGMVSTLIVSGLGLYFTTRARRAPMRDVVFLKQVDLIVRIIHMYGRIKTYATILTGEDNEFKEQAREDMRSCLKAFSEMKEEGAAILPTELWVEVNHLSDSILEAIISFDEKVTIDNKQLAAISAQGTKVALISRAVIGVDELTDESLKLLSTKDDYDRLVEMDVKYLVRLHKKVNSKKDKG